ncbi:glutathione S-transferase family protein [Salipiger abyssi]|uniref:glutathione S-transferase family protein n=1 Tax=Salipiger abyssi TaxID=1250539 RepID=UPI0040581A9D
MILYGRRNSSNSAKVFWALAEMGLEYDLRETGGRFGGTDTPAYRTLHPHGKVPCLELAGGAVWESHAILRFLGGTHPGPLWPEAPLLRAAADAWMDWGATALVPPLGRYRKAPEADKAAHLPAVIKAFQSLEENLAEGAFITGAELTLADMSLAPAVHRWFLIADAQPTLPRLSAYHQRLRGLSGYRTHIEGPLS